MNSLIWGIIKPTIEILILWIVFYRILVFFAGTRAFQVLKGITYLIIAFLISQILGFETLNWILTKIFAISIIAILILFQQELRQGLARLGQQHLFAVALAETEIIAFIEEIADAAFKLSRQQIGALIAIERETKLTTYLESGVALDSKINSEMIQSIFNPQSPLHDGGGIIQGDRISAVSCLFPLSDNQSLSKVVGTRHRAALGISEQTDAVVVLVSEETGEVTIAHDGKFIDSNEKDKFISALKHILVPQKKKKK
jgi:diadenylate cyclase